MTDLSALPIAEEHPAYEVSVIEGRLIVVIRPPFDQTTGVELRALVRVARDLGMDVRVRVGAHDAEIGAIAPIRSPRMPQ